MHTFFRFVISSRPNGFWDAKISKIVAVLWRCLVAFWSPRYLFDMSPKFFGKIFQNMLWWIFPSLVDGEKGETSFAWRSIIWKQFKWKILLGRWIFWKKNVHSWHDAFLPCVQTFIPPSLAKFSFLSHTHKNWFFLVLQKRSFLEEIVKKERREHFAPTKKPFSLFWFLSFFLFFLFFKEFSRFVLGQKKTFSLWVAHAPRVQHNASNPGILTPKMGLSCLQSA